MNWNGGALVALALLAPLVLPGTAQAQRAKENAVAEADDAFGTVVGVESTGIYSQEDTRGFSPKKAGNVRLEGIYFDQVASLSGRLRQSSAIRVGFAAEDFPFPAPTGVVDNRLRPMPEELGASVGLHSTAYGGYISELDLRIPVVADHIGIAAGAGATEFRVTDGSKTITRDLAGRVIFRFAHSEFAPFVAKRWFPNALPPTYVVVDTDVLPKQPKTRRFLGQRWARSEFENLNAGATFKSRVTPDFVIRSGLFFSGGDRIRNFVEIYSILNGNEEDNARHLMIADPSQKVESLSGEAQAVYLADSGRWHHRIYAGYRFRDRKSESGGSDTEVFGIATYGELDPQPEQDFDFSPVNSGRIRQSAIMLGYIGRIDRLATVNLGIQKARYRATFRDVARDDLTRSRANPWLYNAMIDVNVLPGVSVYVGTQRGLEDSGTAPENAANSQQQLPAAKTTQYEAGVHWKLGRSNLFVNVFEITKPYFTFDDDNFFVRLGTVSHRGIEASLSGHFGERLNVVAGALLMQPRVSGEARDDGRIGSRPAGTPSVYARIDANYRTDIFGGLTPTARLEYTGKRAVSASPFASLGDKQLMTDGFVTLDLGARQSFKVGTVPASLRVNLSNVFDKESWNILAANTLQVENRRRLTVSLAADF